MLRSVFILLLLGNTLPHNDIIVYDNIFAMIKVKPATRLRIPPNRQSATTLLGTWWMIPRRVLLGRMRNAS